MAYPEERSNEKEEETALAWLKRSLSNEPVVSPFCEITDAFLCRKQRRQRRHNSTVPSTFIVQEGTGLKFMDELFQSTGDCTNVVVEISGLGGTGKTALAMALVASYVAATSFPEEITPASADSIQIETTSVTERSKRPKPLVAFPQVVFIDSEYGVHIPNLSSSVRTAVIRRWQKRSESKAPGNLNHHAHEEESNVSLEREISSCLSRIHMSYPRDSGTGFVSCIEAIRHALHSHRKRHTSNSPPIMIVLDSISAFDQRDRMLEQIRPGLSGRGDFIRQLVRLLRTEKTKVMLFATTTKKPSFSRLDDAWNKIVTHRVSLEKVKTGSIEEREGFEFVALLRQGMGNGLGVFPFVVTSGGIMCK